MATSLRKLILATLLVSMLTTTQCSDVEIVNNPGFLSSQRSTNCMDLINKRRLLSEEMLPKPAGRKLFSRFRYLRRLRNSDMVCLQLSDRAKKVLGVRLCKIERKLVDSFKRTINWRMKGEDFLKNNKHRFNEKYGPTSTRRDVYVHYKERYQQELKMLLRENNFINNGKTGTRAQRVDQVMNRLDENYKKIYEEEKRKIQNRGRRK